MLLVKLKIDGSERIFKPILSRNLKVYNALAVLILLYGSEIMTLREEDKKKLTSIEGILEQVKEEPVDEKLRRYKSNWLRHVTRMNNNRMPNGQILLGRPLKILLDEAETGLSRPNSHAMVMAMRIMITIIIIIIKLAHKPN